MGPIDIIQKSLAYMDVGKGLNRICDHFDRPSTKPMSPLQTNLFLAAIKAVLYVLCFLGLLLPVLALVGLYHAGFYGWLGHESYDWFIDPHMMVKPTWPAWSWEFAYFAWDLVLGGLRLTWHWLAAISGLLFYLILVGMGQSQKEVV